jgi:CHAD domain-containing protein
VTDVHETEWQFDAVDLRPVERWLDDVAVRGNGVPAVVRNGVVTHVDVYFDTDDRRFERAGYALSVRKVGRRRTGAEATLKALSSGGSGGGLGRRRELTERLEGDGPPEPGRATGPVGERVRALAGSRPLLQLFEVRTRRQTFTIAGVGGATAELALDETTIRSRGGRPIAHLRRVAVDAPDAAVGGVEPFVERMRAACRLQPAGFSKYDAGMVATGPHRPTGVDVGSVEVDPDAPIGVVALAVLRRQFALLLAREPGTRLGDDIEELHQMRVATRRMRAALALFRDVLPADAAPLRVELGWLAGLLGAVRDLDVQLEQLDEWVAAAVEEDRAPLERLRRLLVEQRVDARAAMLAGFESRRYGTLLRRFERMLRLSRGGRAAAARVPVRSAAPDLIERSYKAVRKAARRIGPESPPEDYHRLRIAGKRFRYALEFLADVYPGETRRLVRRLAAVQDVLGLNQDADVAIARLRQLAGERGDELGPSTVFVMGEVAERYRHGMRELQARHPKTFARIRAPWKEFRSLIESRRPESPPAPPAVAS